MAKVVTHQIYNCEEKLRVQFKMGCLVTQLIGFRMEG